MRELWRRTGVNASLADISNSSTLHHVPHSEPLDRLVLGDAARAVGATDEGNMATTLLVATTGASLLSLDSDEKRLALPSTSKADLKHPTHFHRRMTWIGPHSTGEYVRGASDDRVGLTILEDGVRGRGLRTSLERTPLRPSDGDPGNSRQPSNCGLAVRAA